MRRVVVTGMGIVSSLGNNVNEVSESLKNSKSGITFQEEYKDKGLRSQVAGSINLNTEELIDRKLFRFMADGHAYAWLAMQEAIKDAKLNEDQVSNIRTGLIVGAGGTSTESMLRSTDVLKEKGIRRVGPYMVVKTMSNGVTACLATGAKIKGINYSISSACSTSAHCIGNAYEQIQMGKQEIGSFSLNQNVIKFIEGPIGKTERIMDSGKVRISKSPCTKKYCIHQGWINQLNQIII